MKYMKRCHTKHLSILILLMVINCTPTDKKNIDEQENWIPLFNGIDLSGWDIKIASHQLNDNYKNTFRVEDGMLRVMYDEYETFENNFGHIFFNTPYSYYKLRLQYRIIGDKTPGSPEWTMRNSGVMMHSQSAASMELYQDFPVSLEAQLLSGIDEQERPTGNICTPGTQIHMGDSLRHEHCINSTSKTYQDQWVNVTIEVYGDSLIRHIVEKDTVLTYTKPIIGGGFVSESHTWKDAHIENSSAWISKEGMPLKKGYIALQAEGHPVDFRNIELLILEQE